jgi:hypothetical protein
MVEIVGFLYDYKRLNKTQGRCFICNEVSECTITHYKKSFHLFYIPIKRTEEQFIFEWEKCNHRGIFTQKRDIDRYKEEQVVTNLLNVPYYHDMKPILTNKPNYYKPNLIVVMIVCVLFAIIMGIIIILLQILGMRYFVL